MIESAKKVFRALLTVNVASLIRAIRFGISDARYSISLAYRTINPFQPAAELKNLIEEDKARRAIRELHETIPVVELAELVPRLPVITIDPRYAGVDGSLPLHELIPLLCILRHENPRAVFEVGTYFGSTTRNIALNLPDGIVRTIDLPEDLNIDALTGDQVEKDDFHLIKARRVGAAYREPGDITNVIQYFGDTARWDFSQIGPETSFFFIDASHTYSHVRSDTLKTLEVITGESVFFWHDCSLDHLGVTRWIAEMASDGLPVKRVAGTTLAYLKISPDETLRQWLSRHSARSTARTEAVA
jgi:hypothetical protein